MQSVWESARAVAAEEAMTSWLPGYFDGPADAARHIIGSAELRRRAGLAIAWTVVNGNEWNGQRAGHPVELTAMDNANNAIGLAIGARARTYADVVTMAREAIQRGIDAGGTGGDGTPTWLPGGWSEPRARPDRPPAGIIEWRDRDPGGGTYPFGGAEHGFLRGVTAREAERLRLDDLARVPPEAWSEDDVRAVIRSRPYRNSTDPERAIWHQRVRSHFEGRQRAEDARRTEEASHVNAPDTELLPKIAEEDGGGGVVRVRAYRRDGENGPVHVSSHERSAPQP